ncbi:hypothetical protein KDA_39030 [Dictyobacter alpinus]|uniref:Uncharacterized protein n=1 Tax=Dictyobacter alpinus TaxID=2014873 RepID=A0A402BAR1_9CHLR|nr:hypothetical protein [Dictyobacter alpinus]GCE28419.1 hypothetical protein KDA_39030 [Dictyobacter alpinus]
MSILEICVILCLSLAFLYMGSRGLKRDFSTVASSDQLWKSMLRWHVLSDVTSPSPQMLEEIKQSWCYLRAMTVIGGGISLLLLLIVMVAFSLLTTGTIIGDYVNDGMFFTAITYSNVVVGFGLGGAFAVWHLRRVARRKVTYAELRQRQLSDYQGTLLPWIPLAAVVETLLLNWLFAPHIGKAVQVQWNDSIVTLPNNLWVINIVPAAMILVAIVAQCLMLIVTRMSRLLITADPKVSQHADDMLRANVISMVQIYALATVFSLGMIQINVIMRNLWASHYWTDGNMPFKTMPEIFMFVLVLTLVGGGGLAALYSPLGGNHTGWPWQPKRIEQTRLEQ